MSTSVLILGEYPPPFGGVAIHIRSFVPYLLEHGYDANILENNIDRVLRKVMMAIEKPICNQDSLQKNITFHMIFCSLIPNLHNYLPVLHLSITL